MQRNKRTSLIIGFLIAVFAAVGVNAGGPLFMWNSEQRIPYRWDVSSPVPVYTDMGPFEIVPVNITPIPPSVADGIVNFAVQQWTNVETSSFQAQVAGNFASLGLPDITCTAANAASCNAAEVIGTDNGGGIHVIYDQNGYVSRYFLGAPASVLGIASPEWADESTGEITEGWVVINAQRRWTGDDLLLNYAGVFTHELGHAINLAHSQTNGAIAFYSNARGPHGCNTLPYDAANVTVNDIETMYPFIDAKPTTGSGIAQSIVDITDDESAISDLYPAPGYQATRGTIKGNVLDWQGRSGLTGVNVIARNINNPFGDAVSAMSGDWVRVPTNDDGSFTLTGLTPGASYALYIDGIVSGGFPTAQPFWTPGPEEFYNGANESGDGIADQPCSAEPVLANAGTTADANVKLNFVRTAPKFTPLGNGIFPNSMSSDGTFIAGSVNQGPAFRWSESGGFEQLTENSVVNATMSRDGQYFHSEVLLPAPANRASALLQHGGTWQLLPLPVATPPVTVVPCDNTSSAYGVASGGIAASGMVWVDANGPAPGLTCRGYPFKWTPATGSQMLPMPDGSRGGRPNNISDDGSTVVGYYDLGGRKAAIWKNGTLTALTTPTMNVGEAYNTTPDGSIVVGGNAGTTQEPWKWTESGGLVMLGKVVPNGTAVAAAISDDGSVIAGLGGSTSFFPGDISGRKAFIWTDFTGSLDFEMFLKSQGTFIEGWVLNTSTAMSSNGTKLTGVGFGPRGQGGWLIDLSKVNVCHAPPGNPSNARRVSVGFPFSMRDHLAHGDTIGLCPEVEE